MRYGLILFALMFCYPTYAAEQQPPKPVTSCSVQVPYGTPSTVVNHPVICRTAYLLEYDPAAKIPNWVAWTLTPDHVIGCVIRTNAFAADQSLSVGQISKPSDYAGSGYDQGHLANDADMSWDEKVERESFLMSNMSPQLPSVNRGVWKNLESAERAWVYQTKHAHTIYAGNIYSSSSKTIGADKVVIPDFLYKVLIDDTTKRSYAFLFPHKNGLSSDFTQYQVSVADIERLSGTIFPVPDDKKLKNQAPVPDLKTIAQDKKNQCKGASDD